MDIMELDFSEIMRIFLTMSLVGSVVALFLFMLKPIIKNRLPKSFQYYMWFVVLIALILPLSQFFVLPESSVPSNHRASLTPIYSIVQRIFHTAPEEPARLMSLPQGEYEQTIGKTQSKFSNLSTLLFIVWQFGIFTFLGFNIICYVMFARKLQKYNVRASPHETELLNILVGKGYVPHLYLSSLIPTPMLIGVFHPIIILPDKKYTDTQLQNILLHELTHLRKYDIAMKWLSVLAGALHWFNPIIYLVRREIDRACELACDETAIRNLDSDGKQNYGDALIASVADKTTKIALSTTMCEDKKALKERLGAIMKHKTFSKRTVVISSALILMILFSTILLGAASDTGKTKASKYEIVYFDESDDKYQQIVKENEIKSNLTGFSDKINDADVLVPVLDNKIIEALITLRANEEISDSEMDDIILFVSEILDNFDKENIHIKYIVE